MNFADDDDIDESQPVNFAHTSAILDHATPDLRAKWAKDLRDAAPEFTADLNLVSNTASFNAGYTGRMSHSDALQTEFNALSDDEKLLHYAIAHYCKDPEGASDATQYAKGDANAFFSGVAPLTVNWFKTFETELIALRINRTNAATLVLEPKKRNKNAHYDILGVYANAGDKEPTRVVDTIQIGGYTIPSSLLIQVARKYGKHVIPDTEVKGDVVGTKAEVGLSKV